MSKQRRNGYRADPLTVRHVYALGLILVVPLVLAALPAVRELGGGGEAGWAWWVVLMTATQAGYLVWMTLLPDFASVKFIAWVYAMAAAVYALVSAVLAFSGAASELPLGLSEIRSRALAWCVLMLLLMSVSAYLAARLASRWRRMWEEWEARG